jgi:hypothetical protein
VVALNSSATRGKRPLLVWVIFLFILVASGGSLASFALIYSGRAPMSPAMKAYFQSMGIFDYATTALLLALNIAGVILLFRLRKSAVPLLVGASALNVALTIRAELVTNWAQALGSNSSAAISGLGMALAIAWYADRLKRRGLLT